MGYGESWQQWGAGGSRGLGEGCGVGGGGENGINYLPGKMEYVCMCWMEPHCKSTRNTTQRAHSVKGIILFCVCLQKQAHSPRFSYIESALNIHIQKEHRCKGIMTGYRKPILPQCNLFENPIK